MKQIEREMSSQIEQIEIGIDKAQTDIQIMHLKNHQKDQEIKLLEIKRKEMVSHFSNYRKLQQCSQSGRQL